MTDLAHARLLKAREIAASVFESNNMHNSAREARAGESDDYATVQAALAALTEANWQPPGDNPFAFPSVEQRGFDGCGIREADYGMTLRDHYAGLALVGLLHPGWETACESAPRKAYELADLMLAVRGAA